LKVVNELLYETEILSAYLQGMTSTIYE